MIQKLVENYGYYAKDNSKIVTNTMLALKNSCELILIPPAPTLLRVVDELSCNNRSEYGEGKGGHEHQGHNWTSLLVWHKLTQYDTK